MTGMGNKVIDVQKITPRQTFTDSKSGNGDHAILFLHIGEPIARTFLTPYPREKLFFSNMRAKLPHDWIASCNFSIG